MDRPDDNPFWSFSLRVYGQPSVAAACLALQDDGGADVNLVLYLLWCAATGRPLDAAQIARADDGLASWRAGVIEPLRHVRRVMRANLLPPVATTACRDTVKAAELEAERLSQAALFAGAPPPGASEADARARADAYLALYAAHLGRELPQAPVAALLAALAVSGEISGVLVTSSGLDPGGEAGRLADSAIRSPRSGRHPRGRIA